MNLVPDFVINSVTEITPEWMDGRELKIIFLDLDNTLTGYRSTVPAKGVTEWLKLMRPYTPTILSNAKRDRVAAFCEPLGLPYTAKAGKPSPWAALMSCASMGLRPEQAVLAGDQIFTDVLCANRAGMVSVIVEPVTNNLFYSFRRNVIEGRHVQKGIHNI